MGSPTQSGRLLTGPRVVAAMFTMGIVATSLLYAYWTLHLMPFMALQEAIVAEFPGSAPRVDGGQNKMHKDTPKVLRIAMKLKYDPRSEKPADVAALQQTKLRVRQLVEEKIDDPELKFSALNYIELYVYHLVQEKETCDRSFRHETQQGSDWIEVDRKGNPLNPPPTENHSGTDGEGEPEANAELATPTTPAESTE